MKIDEIRKKQVVCLELSKQLKEAGYPQEGLWWWLKNCLNEWLIVDRDMKKYDRSQCSLKGDDGRNLHYLKTHPAYATPTVAELGEKLPEYVSSYKFNKRWRINSFKPNRYFDADTEADARAKMWLHLKKEKFI